MEWTEKELKLMDKADFYNHNKIVAHVLTIPKGTFKNGRFISNLEQNKFYWFLELNSSEPIRLFLSEIHDIEDYKTEVGEDGEGIY